MPVLSFRAPRTCLALGALALLGGTACSDVDGAAIEGTQGGITGGAPSTAARPAVGRLLLPQNGSCTATVIHQQFLLTAAHCVGYSEANPGGYTFLVDGRAERFAISRIALLSYNRSEQWLPLPQAERVPNFRTPDEKGNPDLAVLRLAQAMPSEVAPIPVARNLPAQGERVTVYGYGCTDPVSGNGVGTKRYASWSYAHSSSQQPNGRAVTCDGDSGGPAVFGEVDGSGAIWGVVSSSGIADFYGQAAWHHDAILQAMMRSLGTTAEAPSLGGVGLRGVVRRQLAGGARACQMACIDDGAGCEGWTSADGGCWIFSAVEGWYPSAGAVSSARAGAEDRVDRPGSDLESIRMGPIHADRGKTACRGACAARSDCQSYTFVESGVQAVDAICYLKGAVPGATHNFPMVHSGVRRGIRPGMAIDARPLFTTSAANPAACASSCVRNTRCKAFTWTGASSCVLHSEAGTVRPQEGATSGIRAGLEWGIDRAGSDLGPPIEFNHFSEQPGPERCQMECENNPQCRAFTYVPWTFPDTNARCWLKSGVPLPLNHFKNFVSGVKGGAFF
jgi:hypothetical protein